MQFVFATDDNYWLQTFVAIYSLVFNNRDYDLEIFILCESVDSKFESGIHELKTLNDQVKVNFVLVKNALDQVTEFKVRQHLTRGTYYRFFIQEFLPKSVKKVIYLDGDIIVNGSLLDLYSIDLEGNLLGAVPQPEGECPKRLGLPPGSKYFNAGILVIDLEKWRNDDTSAKLMQYSQANKDNIQWPSQDPLNAIACGQWKELPIEYNYYHGFLERGNPSYLHAEPVIVHYSGLVKPWHYKGSHPYKKLYWSYLRQTPYKFYIPHDFTTFNIISSMIPSKMKSLVRELSSSLSI
jgi:lipopolysaccharide biosynthesis glycosyltransferase